MHHLNSLLADVEKNGVASDEQHSLKEIVACIETIQSALDRNEVIENQTISKYLRLVNTHKTLKYEFETGFRGEIATLFIKIYETKKVSIPIKIRILSALKTLCKKSSGHMTNFKFHWRLIWDEILLIVSRDNRQDAICSENLVVQLISALVVFLHGAREYISQDMNTPSGFGEIVDTAMARLEDTRLPICIEGVLLLLNCLPTNYPKYDQVLPLWISKWSSIQHNANWDCCWATLFCRARKYSTSFDWVAASPFLLTKAKQLMQLPTVESGSQNNSHTEFPSTFPAYYIKLIDIQTDVKNVALMKIAKLMYFLTIFNPALVPAELITVTPPFDTTEESSNGTVLLSGFNTITAKPVNKSAVEMVAFFQSIRTYVYPSNSGSWTQQVAYFVAAFVFQLCRHVGRAVADTVLGTEDAPIDGSVAPWLLYRKPLHLNTVKYVSGSVLSLIMEGLYGKNQVMTQLFSSCLRNLAALDASIGNVFIPFLLTALDPSAVNQSHQAPIAMQTFTLCFKSLIYPSPVILKYLPDIMRLSLPGIDASDASKTTVTMAMYSTILAWIPLTSSYKVPDASSFPPSYASIVSTSDEKHVDVTRLTTEEYQNKWDILAEYLQEWSPALLDKIFAVLDAQETKVKGVRDSPVISAIGQCAGYFFQAIPVSDPLRAIVEEKLMNYLIKSTPKNAAKACAKIMESMISTNPAKLPAVLAQILTPDILSGDTSHDKLTFRLYIASGACRAAHGVNIVASLSVLEPVLTSSALVNHTEKTVRKAIGKLIRDTFKGATSFYPVGIQPLFENNKVIGAPSIASGQIHWHTPDSASLSQMVRLLKLTLDKLVDEIQTSLSPATLSSTANTATTLKKIEDLVSNNLHIIERIVRGAAEVLGDDDFTPLDIEGRDGHLLSTGRSAVWKQLSASDADYLKTLRSRLLNFLSVTHEALDGLTPDNAFYSLKNNGTIIPQWMKLLTLVVTRRTASMKDVENTKKWMTFTKRTARSSIAKMVYRIAKNRDVNPLIKVTPPANNSAITSQWKSLFGNKDFWQFHDLSTNTMACGAWLQHGIRVHELSYNAIRVKIPAKNNANVPTIKCIRQLVALGEHEYDVIRLKAHKQFEKMTGRFGFRLNDIVRGLITNLSNSDTSYLKAIGSLQILKQNRVIKRIMSDWELTEQFLSVISSCQGIISTVAEMDKREKLMVVLSDVFIKYVGGWSHVFLKDGQSTANIIRTSLSNVGHVVETTQQSDAMSVVSDESGNAQAASGLRFETFAAYIMLHFIGHRDVEVTSSIWQWSLEALCKSHGQPAQSIALSALARVAQIAVKQPTFAASSHGATVRSLLSISAPDAKSQWNAMLHGISQCRPKHTDDGSSAQWSKGIDQILRSSEFLKIVLNRNITCTLSERNLYSHHFSRENAGVFYSLTASELLNETDSVFSVKALTSLFEYSKVLPSTNEGEIRSNNATRAELFSGVLRAYNERVKAQTEVVQQVFLSFLLESTEKISLDFMKDWAEAVFFAYSGTVSSTTDVIPKYIIEAFRQLLKSQTSTTANASVDANSEEGFAIQGKVLVLTKALLQADLSNSKTGSVIGNAVVDIVNDTQSNIVSPYRTSRIEIASILAILTELSPVRPDLTVVRGSLVSACTSSKAVTPNPEEMSVSGGNELSVENVSISLTDESLSEKNEAVILKNSSETACIWLQFLIQRIPVIKFEDELVDLLSVSLMGISSGDIELAKMSHDTSIFVCKTILEKVKVTPTGHVTRIINLFDQLISSHASWRVRETTIKCLSIVMVNNWFNFSADLRKQCKDIYAKGLNDLKPEVQHISKAGMVAYLAYKTSNELKVIAEAYIKNSDALAVRERKKRKIQKDSSASYNASEKPDQVYFTTINMMSCVIMCSPYDLPPYMPNLVTSLVRHITNTSLKDTITKTIQLFKMSHQDRWEEFKLKFSREQLEDLQGAGAAHYFS